MQNRVEALLLEKSGDPGALFVFPTDVAASRWADRVLALRGGSLALEQFIAWDTFKAEAVRAQRQDRVSVPAILRKIFVSRLLRENAARPLFGALVPPRYAENASAFASWFAALLPQLGSWYERATGRPVNGALAEDLSGAAGDLSAVEGDLLTLTRRYREFLDAEGLFEPAWEKPPLKDSGKHCYIFFPRCLSDFDEYRELLEGAPQVTLVEPEEEGEAPRSAFFYTNSRSEISGAALYIRRLAERGIPWGGIAVSFPEDGDYEPYVLREFAHRNIPVLRRSGKALSSYPAGRLFSALAGCYAGGFSFESLSALLLNAHLPWKDKTVIDQLINFGIENNCVCSWVEPEGGRELDVWLDAFASPPGRREKRAEDFYRTLKRDITAVNEARSFAELRQRYFIFREHFLDMELCTEESNLVLSRCIAELLGLMEIEKAYPRAAAPDPFALYTEHLAGTMYLPRQEGGGVSLLPYRTLAPVPFESHIILGATQENLSALFPRLSFLPRSRREALGLSDHDASEVFIRLHRYNSILPAAFFCAEETFSGFAIPHSRLNAGGKPRNGEEAPEDFAGDLFLSERSLNGAGPEGSAPESPAGLRLHRVQAEGFEAWRKRRQDDSAERGELFSDPLLHAEILRRYGAEGPEESPEGRIQVSATAMQLWYDCSLSWFFERVLGLESLRTETALMAENVLGSVYHALLDGFFKGLERGGGRIRWSGGEALSPEYRALLDEAAAAVFGGLLAGGGPAISALTARLLRAERKPLLRQTEALLLRFTGLFDGFRVLGSELRKSRDEGDYRLTGTIDCLLEDDREDSPEPGARVIVDFKLSKLPKKAECLNFNGEELRHFQLPMYVTLAEEDGGTVETALFLGILNAPSGLPGLILGGLSGKDGKRYPYRDKDRVYRRGGDLSFEPVLEEFSARAARYAAGLRAGLGSPAGPRESRCYACRYRRICRTVYTVDRERGLTAPAGEA
ncbi:MAG: PD-(D/E)XK nuclease family protein [Spirochaetaceae bacterium]|jgi:RecB family exonuclease|nr:PD-(D/E)XK nuclease family protein [Spirochaetaceae bacterium]